MLYQIHHMITDRLKELAALKSKAAALELKIETERTSALAALPTQFGFSTVAAFASAVRTAAGRRPGRKPKLKAVTATEVAKSRRKRAVITDAMRAEVKKLVEAGKTGTAIAKAVGVSLPSVQNIKKALGLVKKSKK